LQKLQKDYPHEKLVGFFYDPNIHPYSEYKLRFLDVQRSCKKLGIDLIEGEYDFEEWIKAVKGLEKEPEKGLRCEVCFDKRFEGAAHKALELGQKTFTTTLLVSPLKSQEQLKKSGDLFEQKHGIKFLAPDYRSGGGSQDQSRVTKEQQLYRQDYCGCLFGLTMQREQQNRLMDEMFSPISGDILPASIEERLNFYQHRIDLEEKDISYKIQKHKFLNYRIFSSRLIKNKTNLIPSYTLSYSTLARKKAQGRIEFEHEDVHYFNREEIRFISLEHFNLLSQQKYKTIQELIFNPISYEKEHQVRFKITHSHQDLSPIVVVEHIPEGKLTYELDAKAYEDIKEQLVIF